jgi:hypothetical protein
MKESMGQFPAHESLCFEFGEFLTGLTCGQQFFDTVTAVPIQYLRPTIR